MLTPQSVLSSSALDMHDGITPRKDRRETDDLNALSVRSVTSESLPARPLDVTAARRSTLDAPNVHRSLGKPASGIDCFSLPASPSQEPMIAADHLMATPSSAPFHGMELFAASPMFGQNGSALRFGGTVSSHPLSNSDKESREGSKSEWSYVRTPPAVPLGSAAACAAAVQQRDPPPSSAATTGPVRKTSLSSTSVSLSAKDVSLPGVVDDKSVRMTLSFLTVEDRRVVSHSPRSMLESSGLTVQEMRGGSNGPLQTYESPLCLPASVSRSNLDVAASSHGNSKMKSLALDSLTPRPQPPEATRDTESQSPRRGCSTMTS